MKRKIRKRFFSAFLSIICVLTLVPQQISAEEKWPKAPETESKSAILMEVNTGTILYEKKSHEKHYPASIHLLSPAADPVSAYRMPQQLQAPVSICFFSSASTSYTPVLY